MAHQGSQSVSSSEEDFPITDASSFLDMDTDQGPRAQSSCSSSLGVDIQLQHPRLKRLRNKAKMDAGIAHNKAVTEKEKQKKKSGREIKPQKVVTKRQLSNKRSAEVCRAATGLYIGYLEKEISEEEREYSLLIQKHFHVKEESLLMMDKIKQLEKKRDAMLGTRSWLDVHTEHNSDAMQEENHADVLETSHLELDIFEQQELDLHVATIDHSMADECKFSQPFPDILLLDLDYPLFAASALPIDVNSLCSDMGVNDDLGFRLEKRSERRLTEDSSPVTVTDTALHIPDFAFVVPGPRADVRTA